MPQDCIIYYTLSRLCIHTHTYIYETKLIDCSKGDTDAKQRRVSLGEEKERPQKQISEVKE